MRSFHLLILLALCTVLIVGLSQSFTQTKNRGALLTLYRHADRLYREGEEIVNRKDYTEQKEEQLNRDALTAFRTLKTHLEKTDPSFDSLSFFVNFKIGVLEHYFDNLIEAKQHYIHAIELKKNLPTLADSFLFKPYLYTGIILYIENLFDSSLAIYKKAENIASSYRVLLQETERLYNTLGALYYETGNYRQAKNYIEKSLSLIPKSNPYYKQLVVNYKINLASILTKLEEFDEASRIYREIVQLDINRDIVMHNTGVINLRLGAINKALEYFQKVHYTDNRKARLYNDIATAYLNIHKNDSALFYLQLASASDTSTKHSVVKGQTNQTWGDLLVMETKMKEALPKYQTAITHYYPAFDEIDVYENPVVFSGVFSYINLFSTLTSKAEAFEKLYEKENNIDYLKASLDAYNSAFKLAEYVEKSYDSDEARLFLNNIKYGVHGKPIDVSLLLYELTKDENYLEQAWQFDQMNKGSALSYNVYENELRNKDSLRSQSDQERIRRSAITRLSLKAAKETDAEKLKEISNSIRDLEIELGKIQENMMAMDKNRYLKRIIPSAAWIRKKLLDDQTALLSYHLSEKELLILCLTGNNFIYKKIPLDQTFYFHIDSFSRALHTVSGENRFDADGIGKKLFLSLIGPVYPHISDMNRLVIIPDDELNYIPFEALEDSAGNYLIQKFSVQYQYSASLLEKKKRKIAADGILSFAPFANASHNQLAYSADEISDLDGKRFFDKEATKENFLSQANKLAVIHLATHAKVNDSMPSQSYISFAGHNPDLSESRLYAQEIYDLSLDSTQLIILSACETGTGQLVHGEGIMSLSRAFAYAGCPDIITSLWKAEDKTTAFMTRRLHYYLANKKTTDQALHLAKLDLLNSNEIDERLKTPNFWAHIIFIGEYEPTSSSLFKWQLLIPVLIAIIAMILFLRNKKR
ncbi:MAG TPA: CHAT domain-containing protein [Chitinophagaceae bacterium]|nr:CHAT domain-containing protein [Chitinophagaceae bacterium]